MTDTVKGIKEDDGTLKIKYDVTKYEDTYKNGMSDLDKATVEWWRERTPKGEKLEIYFYTKVITEGTKE